MDTEEGWSERRDKKGFCRIKGVTLRRGAVRQEQCKEKGK
jgi:hypothetical protein